MSVNPAAAPPDHGMLDAPLRVGAYLLHRRLGDGGMGSVYEGRRADAEFSQRVAVKLLRAGADGDVAARRVRYERQILASLQHPNIAALLDGGTTADGQPYLVMEYVDGAPITAWCDARTLTLRERVALLRDVCAAVEHAHQQLVVHRDLTPANILITADGVVKLLDFGIARLTRPGEALDQLPPTIGGETLGTPEYASPEQLLGRPVTTATDVHGLGAVLFHLLTGAPPLTVRGLLPSEVQQRLETPPPRASASVHPGQGARCGGRDDELRAALAGDLDAILQVALHREPERRYPSASALRDDLQRWLDGRPVVARQDGVAYRISRLLRRRRGEVIGSIALIASLIGSILVSRWQYGRAELERARTQAMNDFLTGMLGAADPGSLGRDVTVRAVLDSAALHLDTLRREPRLEGDLRLLVARTYRALGIGDAARAQTMLALAAHRRATPGGSYEESTALVDLGILQEDALQYDEAERTFRQALALSERFVGADDPETHTILRNLARLRHDRGDLAGADSMYRVQIAYLERAFSSVDEALVTPLNNLATLRAELGDYAEATALLSRALAIARRYVREDHPRISQALAVLAPLTSQAGDVAAADTLFPQVLALRERTLGAGHPDYAFSAYNYSQHLITQRRWREARQWGERVLAARGSGLADASPIVSGAMQSVGLATAHEGDTRGGERLLREALANREAALGADHWLSQVTRSHLAEVLALQGKHDESETMQRAAERALREGRGARAFPTRDARRRLAELYDAMGRASDAAAWRDSLRVTGTTR